MDQNIIRQIQKIKENSRVWQQKIREIFSSASSFIALGRWDKLAIAKFIRSAAVLDKKALDSSISLNVIYKNLVYDNYDISEKNFFKNAIYISDTIPEEAPKYTPISFDISYRNKGLFNAWKFGKGIRLRTRVYRTSGTPQLYDPVYTYLDTTEIGNVPGDTQIETYQGNTVQILDTKAKDIDFRMLKGYTTRRRVVFSGGNIVDLLDGGTWPFSNGTSLTFTGLDSSVSANNKTVTVTTVSGSRMVFPASSFVNGVSLNGTVTNGTTTVSITVSPSAPMSLDSLHSFDLVGIGRGSDGLIDVGNAANNGTLVSVPNMFGSDGNFGTDSNSDGIGDGWSTTGTVSAQSMSGNIQHFTASSANSKIWRPTPSTVGLKIYAFAYVKATSSLVRASVTNNSVPYIPHTGSGMFEFLSGIGTNNTSLPSFYVQDSRTSGWDDIAVKQSGMIALTGILAKLSKTELDKLVKYCLATYGYATTWNVTIAAILQTIALKDTSSVALEARGLVATYNTDGSPATFTAQDRVVRDVDGKYKLSGETVKFVFNGSENWVYNSSFDNTNTVMFYITTGTALTRVTNEGTISSFQYSTSVLTNDVESWRISNDTAGTIAIRISKTRATDLASFKIWLAGNNVTCICKRTTPTITELHSDNQTAFAAAAKSFDGITNIMLSTPGGEMVLDYDRLDPDYETNADYNRVKTFHVTTDNDYPAGEYTFTTTVIDNEMNESDYDEYYVNSPYSKQITITE